MDFASTRPEVRVSNGNKTARNVVLLINGEDIQLPESEVTVIKNNKDIVLKQSNSTLP